MDKTTSFQTSPFIPLLLVNVALLLILSWQLWSAWSARSNLRTQFEQRKDVVRQSEQVQGNVQNIINALIDLSATDSDAKQIVDKYNIRRNAPAQ
ncbi:MAG: hypothetical protein ACFCUX_06620 [Candidatus Methylacidiphilales bacterium]